MSISVAKAVFTSALLRSDAPAPEIRRDDAALFAKAISRTTNVCTASEVKACKDFSVRNIVPSINRTTAFSKYLIALSRSCTSQSTGDHLGEEYEGLNDSASGKSREPPTPAYRRLHILYMLHDVMCFLHVRLNDPAHSGRLFCHATSFVTLKSTSQVLAQLAVGNDGSVRGYSTTLEPVNKVVSHWEKLNVVATEQCAELRRKVTEAASLSWEDLDRKISSQEAQAILDEQRRKGEESKWIIPRQHHLPHDPTTSWHDLPAANALYQKRMRGTPLRANALIPGGVFLQRGGQQADASLRKDVDGLHQEALRCFDKYTNAEDVQDIDALGSIVWTDRPTRNYYGFTYESVARRAKAQSEDAW